MKSGKIKFLFILLLFICFCFSLAPAPVGAQQDADTEHKLALHYYRGLVNFKYQRYQQALDEFRVVGEIDPLYKDTKKFMASCIKALEQERKDLYKTPKGSSIKDDTGFDLYFLGKAYYEKQDYDRALKIFKEVLSQHPDDTFARYYAQLCEKALSGEIDSGMVAITPEEKLVNAADNLEKEVAFIKSDIKEQKEIEKSIQNKAERKASRDELIRQKELELRRQEELLLEEKADYKAQAKIARRLDEVKSRTEKWKRLKEKISSKEPGVPTDLTQYPGYINKGDAYFDVMKESLEKSRWNSAGLNAVSAAINYCDSVLVYLCGLRSSSPKHENICRLMLSELRCPNLQENVSRMRYILNLNKLAESEGRPFKRREAVSLSENAEKLMQWCKGILP